MDGLTHIGFLWLFCDLEHDESDCFGRYFVGREQLPIPLIQLCTSQAWVIQ
ncbi:hypothetical protein [Shewanella donghaensis]|uniref:hypothetical protein n=1 Tax=Shewanella donghaensis TaxID=238836 RepID=UPI0013157C3B|nr:hypothetical protein [Shewanella donghaensis]